MKLLVDMNLPPLWVPALRQGGHDAVHWSDIGPGGAPDAELMLWARTHGAALLTCDLDFASILASGGASAPSVVQLRSHDVLPASAGATVLAALDQFQDELEAGALISVDSSRARARVLPIQPR
ncbi:DUF5615 family PIN-like protein [Rubrivirga sp.]|uniref:DUF5615 family PIN-like protein n=1 Tax=Rubrivirga sp. TaxID=1885344 RepID=UPI003C73C6CD